MGVYFTLQLCISINHYCFNYRTLQNKKSFLTFPVRPSGHCALRLVWTRRNTGTSAILAALPFRFTFSVKLLGETSHWGTHQVHGCAEDATQHTRLFIKTGDRCISTVYTSVSKYIVYRMTGTQADLETYRLPCTTIFWVANSTARPVFALREVSYSTKIRTMNQTANSVPGWVTLVGKKFELTFHNISMTLPSEYLLLDWTCQARDRIWEDKIFTLHIWDIHTLTL